MYMYKHTHTHTHTHTHIYIYIYIYICACESHTHTHSLQVMVLNPSSDPNKSPASQDLPPISWNPEVHYLLLAYVIVVYVFLDTATLTEVFPCFFLSCKANARVNLAKTGHGPHSHRLLCCSMYCLFCVVLCIVCV